MKRVAKSNHLAIYKISRIDKTGVGLGSNVQSDYQLYACFLDVNNDQVDELLFGLTEITDWYTSDIVIFQYKDGKIQELDEFISGFPIYTEEFIEQFKHDRYPSPRFTALGVRQNSVEIMYSCVYYGDAGDMYYDVDGEDTSKDEFEAYYRRVFVRQDKGKRVRFDFLYDFIRK